MVAANIRDIRKRRGLKVSDLAERCQRLGAEGLTANVVENIEHGRRRHGVRTRLITVEELLVIAQAMSVPPAALLPELGEGPEDTPILFGLEDMESGLRATLDSIADLKGRIARRAQEGPQ